MPRPRSLPKSDLSWLDLNLPVPEAALPRFHDLPLEWVFALNAQLWASTVYDDAYFARSLARKNPDPFVM